MFSGKSSRAGSASSAHREPLPESSDNDMPETYPASDFDSSLEGVSLKYRKHIESHPLGKMILRMAFDSTQLAKRVKMDSMELNIEDLCREFYVKTQSDEQNLDKKLDLLAEKLEKALIDKDLNNHTNNQAVKPPSNFSPVPTRDVNVSFFLWSNSSFFIAPLKKKLSFVSFLFEIENKKRF